MADTNRNTDQNPEQKDTELEGMLQHILNTVCDRYKESGRGADDSQAPVPPAQESDILPLVGEAAGDAAPVSEEIPPVGKETPDDAGRIAPVQTNDGAGEQREPARQEPGDPVRQVPQDPEGDPAPAIPIPLAPVLPEEPVREVSAPRQEPEITQPATAPEAIPSAPTRPCDPPRAAADAVPVHTVPEGASDAAPGQKQDAVPEGTADVPDSAPASDAAQPTPEAPALPDLDKLLADPPRTASAGTAEAAPRNWRAHTVVTDTSGARKAHPVSDRYRSFPLPDPNARPAVPIPASPVPEQEQAPVPGETSDAQPVPESVREEASAPDLTPDPVSQADAESADAPDPAASVGQTDDQPAFSAVEDSALLARLMDDGESVSDPVGAAGQDTDKPAAHPLRSFRDAVCNPAGSECRVGERWYFGTSGIGDVSSPDAAKRRQREVSGLMVSARLRCWFALALLVFLFVWEVLPNQMEQLIDLMLLTRVPGAALLIDLQCFLLLCLVGYRPILRGFAALRHGQVLPETLTALAATVCVAAQTALYLMQPLHPWSVCFLGGCLIGASVLTDYFRTASLVSLIRVYTHNGYRYTARLSDLTDDPVIAAAVGDAAQGIRLDAEPASDVGGFSGASRNRRENTALNLSVLALAALAALVDFIVLTLMGRGTDYALWSAVTVFSAAMPLAVFGVHGILFALMGRHAADERVGVADEAAVDAFADASLYTFEDTEAFPSGSIQIKGIKLRGDFRLDRALYLVSGVFSRLGGPLNGVFGTSTADIEIPEDVVIRSIDDGGVESRINGEDVCVGTKEYMASLGIPAYHDSDDARSVEENNMVLYVAYRTQICAKFYIKYEINPAFEANVDLYSKNGITSVIRTADPLINRALLDRISYISDRNIVIVKKTVAMLDDGACIPRTSDLMTCGPRRGLRGMPICFRAYRHHRRFQHILTAVAAAVNAVAVPVGMALIGRNAFMETPIWGTILQLFWALPAAVSCWMVARYQPNR